MPSGTSSPAPSASGTPEPSPAPETPASPSPADHRIAIVGATRDGGVAFTRGIAEKRSLELFDATSGAASVLAAHFGPADRVVVSEKTIAVWTAVDADGIGELSMWSRQGGLVRVAAKSIAGVFATSEDTARASWLESEGSGANRSAGLVVGAPASAAHAPAVHGVVVGSGACEPALRFVGQQLFAATCARGEASPTVRGVGENDAVATAHASTSGTWSVDDEGQKLFFVSPAGAASVVSLADHAITHIDDDVVWGLIAPEGYSVLYRTKAGVLKRAGVSAPVDTMVVAAHNDTVLAVSPGFLDALTSSSAPDTNASVARRDLAITPISPGHPLIPTPTKPILLVETRTAIALGFTPGGDRALYLTDVAASGLPIGALRSRALGAGDDRLIAQGVLMPTMRQGSSTVVFADHPRVEGERLVAVDLHGVDAAGSTASSTYASDVDPAFAVTEAAIVFSKDGRVFSRPLR